MASHLRQRENWDLANRSDADVQKDVVSLVAPLVGSSRRGLEPRNAKATEFSYWLPVEDYLQTSHGLMIPADLLAMK